MADESIDAVVTDPPYGISFMGSAWDTFDPSTMARRVGRRDGNGPPSAVRDGRSKGRAASAFANPAGEAGAYDFTARGNRAFQGWCEAWATEALRVLKPGGHLIAFGGTRTYHRLVCGIEDAGFEIRDQLAWLFGSGFPKSLDVSKAIDTAAGAEREVIGPGAHAGRESKADLGLVNDDGWEGGAPRVITAPATPEAETWEGWGTALKPGHEPIVLARKPLTGTVASNVLEHGTGAINVDGCRVDVDDQAAYVRNSSGDRGHDGTRDLAERGVTDLRPGGGSANDLGRWPANVVLDEAAAELLDEQTGELRSGANPTRRGSDKFRGVYGDFVGQEDCEPARGADAGGASRFYYCAKVSRAERDAGLDGFERGALAWSAGDENPGSFQSDGTDRTAQNSHPTVKPIALMRWLVRMVTPPGGTVLDLFTGSGTTGCATVLEGFRFVGVERDAGYMRIAEARIRWWAAQPAGVLLDDALDAEQRRKKVAASGQLNLLT